MDIQEGSSGSVSGGAGMMGMGDLAAGVERGDLRSVLR
jgi:hypothetical protein